MAKVYQISKLSESSHRITAIDCMRNFSTGTKVFLGDTRGTISSNTLVRPNTPNETLAASTVQPKRPWKGKVERLKSD